MSSMLFVSDLDFTLLRSDGTLSPTASNIVNRIIDEGVLFTYATARSFRSSRAVTRDLELRLPLITYGGTITALPDGGTPTRVDYLPISVTQAVLAEAANSGIEPLAFTMDEVGDRIRWREQHMSPGTHSFISIRAGDPRLQPIDSWEELDLTTVFYLTLIAPHCQLKGLQRSLAKELSRCANVLSRDGYTGEDWLEIHNLNATKAHSIERLREALGAEGLVVFGDNVNDVPMFEIAQESYAVGNAIAELKEIATGIIGSNDNDGVAHWLEHRLLR